MSTKIITIRKSSLKIKTDLLLKTRECYVEYYGGW